jgi:hypothetical protein
MNIRKYRFLPAAMPTNADISPSFLEEFGRAMKAKERLLGNIWRPSPSNEPMRTFANNPQANDSLLQQPMTTNDPNNESKRKRRGILLNTGQGQSECLKGCC